MSGGIYRNVIDYSPMGMSGMDGMSAQLVLSTLNSIIGSANIKAGWVFGATGTQQTVTDSSNGYVATFRDNTYAAINASTCTPGLIGLAPYLTFDSTHIWNTPDVANLSFIGTAGTLLWFGTLKDVAAVHYLVAKCAAANYEYAMYTDASGKLNGLLYSADGSIYIGRLYNTALTVDSKYHLLAMTWGTGTTNANIKLYKDGAAVDDTDNGAGVFTTMVDGTSLVGNYFDNSGTPINIAANTTVLVGIFSGQLTALQMIQINYVLKNYAGINP
jgi:hypothetical protein